MRTTSWSSILSRTGDYTLLELLDSLFRGLCLPSAVLYPGGRKRCLPQLGLDSANLSEMYAFALVWLSAWPPTNQHQRLACGCAEDHAQFPHRSPPSPPRNHGANKRCPYPLVPFLSLWVTWLPQSRTGSLKCRKPSALQQPLSRTGGFDSPKINDMKLEPRASACDESGLCDESILNSK